MRRHIIYHTQIIEPEVHPKELGKIADALEEKLRPAIVVLCSGKTGIIKITKELCYEPDELRLEYGHSVGKWGMFYVS